MSEVEIIDSNVPSATNNSVVASNSEIADSLKETKRKISISAAGFICDKTGLEFDVDKQSFADFLIEAKNKFCQIEDIDTLKKDVEDFRFIISNYREMFTEFLCPIQLMTGVILKQIKKLSPDKNFMQVAKEMFPKLSAKTRENYMNASDILDYPELKDFTNIGLTPLYKLANLLKKAKKKNEQNNVKLAEFLKEIAVNDEIDEADYELAIYYRIFMSDLERYCTLDRELYFKLFKNKFEFSITKDIFFIKNNYIIDGQEDLDFANRYFSNLLSFEFNRSKAQKETLGLSDDEDISKASKSKAMPFNKAVAIIKESTRKLADDNKKLTDSQLEELDTLIKSLQSFYQLQKGE